MEHRKPRRAVVVERRMPKLVAVARAVPRLAFAAFAAYLAAHELRAAASWLEGPDPYGARDAYALALLALGPAIALIVGALASARSDAGLALAAGLVVGAVGRDGVPIALAAAVVAIAVGPWTWGTVRERAPLAGLGFLVGACVAGLSADAAATTAPDVQELMRWWSPDPAGERALRVVLEVTTIGTAIAFARGRTWGALALGPVALGLAWCAVSLRGPLWGSGCVAHGHALAHTSWSVVLVPTLVALWPWSVPLARALRRTFAPTDPTEWEREPDGKTKGATALAIAPHVYAGPGSDSLRANPRPQEISGARPARDRSPR